MTEEKTCIFCTLKDIFAEITSMEADIKSMCLEKKLEEEFEGPLEMAFINAQGAVMILLELLREFNEKHNLLPEQAQEAHWQ